MKRYAMPSTLACLDHMHMFTTTERILHNVPTTCKQKEFIEFNRLSISLDNGSFFVRPTRDRSQPVVDFLMKVCHYSMDLGHKG